MADRVHPRDSPPLLSEPKTSSPQSGTYVIHIPKDQVYRVPPPENAAKYNNYTRRRNNRRGCCCRFCCWFIGIIFLLILLLGIAAAVLYLVFRPTAPDYSIQNIAIRGLNLTSQSSSSSSPSISPEFDVTVRANNPNSKIGIRYEKDSSAEIFFKDVRLCNGAVPAFYQPANNVTVFETALRGEGIELRSGDVTALVKAQNKREVALGVKLRVPVKIKVGAIETWKITVKVNCDVTVDKLTALAKIVSRHCNYGVDILGR